MREPRRDQYKKRRSTKDRFVSILHGQREEEVITPWYRERRNYLPLLAIFMFIVLWYGLRILQENNFLEDNSKTVAPITEPTPQPTMDYDDAKQIFGEDSK
ncbi:MAG: hypothetical protein P9L94_07895 [Candidatus Hinthialibacter antarcticus]|nr:hypothetical protein [Candidatus Hinthialibacter antarcticus]